MTYNNFKKKDSVIVVYTGDGKGKTSAALGLMTRALGTGWKIAFIQFIKLWDVGEHNFIKKILPLYKDELVFYKGGLGFYNAGELSSKASKEDHINEASKTYEFALKAVSSGDYNLVICDEINNAYDEGLLNDIQIKAIIDKKHPNTSLCMTGRNFPDSLVEKVDIVTNMTKIKHHFDDKLIANEGIDY